MIKLNYQGEKRGARDALAYTQISSYILMRIIWLQALSWEGSSLLSVPMRLIIKMIWRYLGEGYGSVICPCVWVTWKKVQAMSLHDEWLVRFVCVWIHGLMHCEASWHED